MEIIQLNVLTEDEIIGEVINVSASLVQLKEILSDTGFMDKSIDKAFDELIGLLGEIVEDVKANRNTKRKGK